MKDILIFVPNKFEDTELTAVADVFDRSNISYDFVSIHNKFEENGSHFIKINTIPIDKIDANKYNGIFLPGGSINNQYLDNPQVVKIIKQFYNEKKLLTAICAGPETYFKLSLFENIKYTAHPGFAESPNKVNKNVVIDGNFITGKDYKASLELGHEIVKKIKSQT